ncbi:MAG: 5-formyltetrahydrofolate cyclo-ligase [Xanthomonadales bacterium]|nr:5-formyltetrahydrofolate cyclo-ligase [Xanthomonadales bacterium]
MNPSKTLLRHYLRSRRSDLSDSVRANHDEAIGRQVLQLINSRQAQRVACYWPFNGEPDITPVYKQLMADGHGLALPVISGKSDHRMQFHSWREDTELDKNSYGIFEPQKTAPIALSSVDILIMPLVGYDLFGNRLGMGGGYYDRCLEPLRNKSAPLRVGIAYSLQEIDPIDKNKWDIPLHGLVNEHGWFTFVSQEQLSTLVEG